MREPSESEKRMLDMGKMAALGLVADGVSTCPQDSVAFMTGVIQATAEAVGRPRVGVEAPDLTVALASADVMDLFAAAIITMAMVTRTVAAPAVTETRQ